MNFSALNFAETDRGSGTPRGEAEVPRLGGRTQQSTGDRSFTLATLGSHRSCPHTAGVRVSKALRGPVTQSSALHLQERWPGLTTSISLAACGTQPPISVPACPTSLQGTAICYINYRKSLPAPLPASPHEHPGRPHMAGCDGRRAALYPLPLFPFSDLASLFFPALSSYN